MNGYKAFEEKKWSHQDQLVTFRHKAALNLVTEEPIFDIGCGDGLFLQMLKLRGFTKLVGIDFSETAIKKAHSKGIKAQVHDLSNPLSFEDNSFETVVMLDVLEHLYNPEEVLSEVRRVGKYLVLSVPNFNSLDARLRVLIGKIPLNNQLKKGHVYWLNRAELHRLLSRRGFKILKEDYYIYWMDRKVIGRGIRALGSCFPSLFATAFILKATK